MTEKSLTYDNDPIEQSKLDLLAKSWSRMVNGISHDMVTPLVVIRMTGETFQEILPGLIEGYNLAIQNNLPLKTKVSKRHLEAFEEGLLPDIRENVNKLLSFLNLLHPYNQQLLSTAPEIKLLSIKSCIDEALKNYPYDNDQQRALIHRKDTLDFKFNLAPMFIEHLLSNLISNALRAIDEENRGEITLSTAKEDNYHVLHFKDTASGLNEDARAQVFNRFFSKRGGTIVPGLGFCRLALLQRNGDILCDSVKQQYTDFIIKFPVD